jgi:Flp pilus assembly pilin Flp
MNIMRRFFWDDDGATAVEYAIMLSLILMVAFTAIATLGSNTGNLWGRIESGFQSASVGQ